MRALSRVFWMMTIGFISLITLGCASFYTTFNERAMTVDDVINMSKAEVDSTVIMRQIEVTRSRFKLEPADIIRLKDEGVEGNIIEYMIETDFIRGRYSWEYGYRPYYGYWPYYGYRPYRYWYSSYYYYPGYRYYNYYRYRSGYSPYRRDYYRGERLRRPDRLEIHQRRSPQRRSR